MSVQYTQHNVYRTISELEAQLDYERLRREKLEAQLDQYRREIADLKYELQARTYGSDQDVSIVVDKEI